MKKVLFVCMGNICRSPTAEGIFRNVLESYGLSEKVMVDSAGTHAYHIGNPPDPRAQETALRRGVDLSRLRARKVAVEDFQVFDYILAMDRENLHHLQQICPQEAERKLKLFLEYAPDCNELEVPDPYYGGINGFERVYDMIEAASTGLAKDILNRFFK